MQSLFPTRARPNATSNQTNNSSISFHAGKCMLSSPLPSGKVTVTADPRKGMIQLERSVDGLMHLKWIERTNNHCEDDIIVFPGDIQFKRINTGKDQDRVYSLRVLNSPIKRLFWMQAKSSEQDQTNIDKLMEMANNPRAGGNAWEQAMGLPPGAALGFPGMTRPSGGSDLGLGNLDLSALLAQFAPTTAAPAASSSSATTVQTPAPATVPQVGAMDTSQSNLDVSTGNVAVNLFPDTPAASGRSELLTSAGLLNSSILSNADVLRALAAVLPADRQSDDSIRGLFAAPPASLHRALGELADALRTDPSDSSSVVDRLASMQISSGEGDTASTEISDQTIRAILSVIERYARHGS